MLVNLSICLYDVYVTHILPVLCSLMEDGGDWDRRNRFKVYEGMYCITNRDFKTAAQLFCDSLATFTCTELLTYTDLVKYAVITAMCSFDRVTLKKKVINCPEILEAISAIPYLEQFMTSFYYCRYADFFRTLAELEGTMKKDHWLFAHYRIVVKEMRIKAYSQLLESYRSLTISAMAEAFGVSKDFIDA